MPSIDIVRVLSGVVVAGFGLWLIGLAILIATSPSRAEAFLKGFASSALTHYTEQGVRLLVGGAIVHFASSMRHPEFFRPFGWLVVASTVALLLIPWQWHRRFGAVVMPSLFQRLRWLAFGALALGVFVLWSVSRVVIP